MTGKWEKLRGFCDGGDRKLNGGGGKKATSLSLSHSLSLSEMLCTGNKYSVINNGKKMIMVGR